MSPEASLLAIASALLIGAMSPGPSFLVVSRISIAQSRLHGIAAAIGTGAGGTVFASMALLGQVALLNQWSWLHSAVKIAGGLYLIRLGVQIWRGAKEPLPHASPTPNESRSLQRAFLSGCLTQLSNPKTAVVYASVFAALLPTSPPAWLLVTVPPLVFALEFGWYATVASTFSSAYARSTYLCAKIWVDRLAGAVMTLLGLRLILDAVGDRKP